MTNIGVKMMCVPKCTVMMMMTILPQLHDETGGKKLGYESKIVINVDTSKQCNGHFNNCKVFYHNL
jgi:hypothetical protein